MHAEAMGSVVVITDAGCALGRALASAFCRRGFQVVGFGLIEAVLAETRASAGKDLFAHMVVDVASQDAVRSAFHAIGERWGGVSILFNNAEVRPHVDFLQETGSSFMQTIGRNLGGVVFCTRAALETMTLTGHGRIINVGGLVGTAPPIASSAYSVSNGATRIFTQALVADLADRFPDIVISTWISGDWSTGIVEPDIAAEWGVDLALRNDRSLNGAEFDQDREITQARSLTRRIVDIVRRRVRVPGTLGVADVIRGLKE